MSADPITGWTPSPWFLVSRPAVPASFIQRPHAVDAITASVTAHLVTEVTAPPGYAKSTTTSQWAATDDVQVAWLSLTRFDNDPGRIDRGVATALRALADRSGSPSHRSLLDLVPAGDDHAASYDALSSALAALDAPVALVVDDTHLAGKALDASIVGALIEHPMSKLRLVLVGNESQSLSLNGLRMRGELGSVGVAELAFTVDDVIAAGRAIGASLSGIEATEMLDATAGWPAAVRLGLVTRDPAGIAIEPDASAWLAEFVSTEVIDRLPAELADFVLAVTSCTRVDAALAAELSGATDSSVLLDECMRRALFLDRFEGPGRQIVYRWNDVFAESCQALLHRRSPERAAELHRVAARWLAGPFPLEAIGQALQGNDNDLATEIIGSSWISLVVRSQAGAVDQLCIDLGEPWNTDPGILAVRASCRDADGDRAGAELLLRRAAALQARAQDHATVDRFAIAAAKLFLANDPQSLFDAIDEVTGLIGSPRSLSPRTYATGLFLLGWTEMRLRRDPGRAIDLLRSAARECEAVGEVDVAQRATVNLRFALAFAGRFNEAQALGTDDGATTADAETSFPYDGGIESMAVGFIAYWRDDLDAATHALRHAVDVDGGDATYSALARIYLAFVASVTGGTEALAAAEAGLDFVSDITQHGVPWPTYKAVARMRLADARGHVDEAVELAGAVYDAQFVPTCSVMAAEVLRRGGHLDRAEVMLDAITPSAAASFIKASSLVTRSLIAAERGDPDAHRLLETGLDVAVPESIALPFAGPDPVLRALLIEHATWGTRHEGFVASRIATGQASVSRHQVLGDGLSAREHEVLSLMRTTMTAADIAAALYVSINTVKTHQRAIYRKLGVTNRRDAIRAVI